MLHPPARLRKRTHLWDSPAGGVLGGCPVGADRQSAKKADILFGTVGGMSVWMFDGEATLCQEVWIQRKARV